MDNLRRKNVYKKQTKTLTVKQKKRIATKRALQRGKPPLRTNGI